MAGKLTTAMAWTFTLVSLGGCYNDAPIEARGERYDHPWLTVGSNELRRDILVSEAHRTRDEFGLIHVSIPVRSTNDKQLYVDYRVWFSDVTGAEIGTPQTGTLTIPSHGLRTITAASTSPRAESFRVELSYPRIN